MHIIHNNYYADYQVMTSGQKNKQETTFSNKTK